MTKVHEALLDGWKLGRLIRHKHAYFVLLRHRFHTHTLLHTGYSTLLPGQLDLFLSFAFPAQSPFVAVQSLPRQCDFIREIILWKNLTEEHCQRLLLACFPPCLLSRLLLPKSFSWCLSSVIHFSVRTLLSCSSLGKFSGFWGFFFRFRLCKPWRYPSLQLHWSSAHPAWALWEVSHVRPNKR